MSAPRSVTANFTLKTYTITATAGANGTITPSGTVTVNHGATQTFTITANTGYHVADVKVDGSSVGALTSYTFTNVTANHTINATFAINNTYTLSVSKKGSGTGTVKSVPAGIDCGSDCTEDYPPNTSVTLTATPDSSSTFTSWSAYCSGTGNCSVVISGNKCTLKMCGPCNATATFKIKTYTITATAGSNGSISPKGSVKVNHGASQTFTIKPNSGYKIASVKVDNVPVNIADPYKAFTYTFSNVTSNHTISATFKR
jgi:hypothetical protein